MRVLDIIQSGLFLVVLYLSWTRELIQDARLVFLGALLGLLVHWALTNKGNRNIVNIRPLGAGFRVLVMDMVLIIALLNGFLLKGWDFVLIPLSAGAILLDYSLGG